MSKKERFMTTLGWIATGTAILMYVSYIPQIISNLHGAKGNPAQPLATVLNTLLWVIYALFKDHRDYPLAVSNGAGVIFGALAVLTAL